jgi:UDP-N-acetylglucosamine 2-epimerase (non-hydrolysing)
MKKNVMVVIGTRPEAIKMAPVVFALKESDFLNPIVVSTGQHTDLLRTALNVFGIVPDIELSVMTPSQTLATTAAKIIERFEQVLSKEKPAAVLVQGDTTTAFASGLAAYYSKIPLGHIEAGLRTYDHENPFPEEANRQLVDRISTWCFPPTETSKKNLLNEQIDPKKIHVTGNTGIDALLWALGKSESIQQKPQLLVTLHRRESFGEPLREILNGIIDFLKMTPDAQVIWPVHPNPNVREIADQILTDHKRIQRIDPQEYFSFARLMAESRLILSDSGGVQEEAPSLGKRVLIARDSTERPEAVVSGQNRLVGRNRIKIKEELSKAWLEPPYSGQIPASNPYGNGQASKKITFLLENMLK